jgi:hypothetical protein
MFVGSGCQNRQPSVYKMFWKRLATQLFDVPSGRMLLVNCNVVAVHGYYDVPPERRVTKKNEPSLGPSSGGTPAHLMSCVSRAVQDANLRRGLLTTNLPCRLRVDQSHSC